jgi:hypothetical protein
MTVQFQVGRTYSTRSIGDHECIYSFKILGRTAKTVTVVVENNKVVRRGLYIHNDIEHFKPFGTYSMCAIIGADDKDLTLPTIVGRLDVVLDSVTATPAKPIYTMENRVKNVAEQQAAARDMLAALKRLTHADTKPGRTPFNDWYRLPSQTAGREAIAKAEAAGITAED